MQLEDFLPDLNKTAQKHFDRVQNKLAYCITCQPYDGDSYIWALGQETTLDELFEELAVPEKYRDDISENLSCNNCGKSSFERYETVGTENVYDGEIYKHLDKAESKYGKQIKALQELLQEYPSLGLLNPLSKKLHKVITEGKVLTSNISGEWFRARKVKNSSVFRCDDMEAAPVGLARDGRYHHAGQSVLYLAETEETAVHEVLEFNDDSALVWIQEYKIISIDNILDLASSLDELGPEISELLVALISSDALHEKVEDRKNNWKPQYFLTRFIADCAKSAGYNGIRYMSTRGYSDNVVIFKWNDENLKSVGKPRVLIHEIKK